MKDSLDHFIGDLYTLMHDYNIDYKSAAVDLIRISTGLKTWQTKETKLSPDWSTAPDWANWWMRNREGRAVWTEDKPELREGYGFVLAGDGRRGECHIENWEKSLQERPQ
jgi:hypothetical protein